MSAKGEYTEPHCFIFFADVLFHREARPVLTLPESLWSDDESAMNRHATVLSEVTSGRRQSLSDPHKILFQTAELRARLQSERQQSSGSTSVMPDVLHGDSEQRRVDVTPGQDEGDQSIDTETGRNLVSENGGARMSPAVADFDLSGQHHMLLVYQNP